MRLEPPKKLSFRPGIRADPEPLNGPDGGTAAGGVTNLFPHRDLSGIIHSNRTMFLVGVFRDSAGGNPAGTPPASLGFSDPENFGVLAPQLNQLFFVGDGRTDNTNDIQSFLVPTGATRLFLGFADGNSFIGFPGHYSDNSGQLVADFAFTAVPEPSTYALIGIALGGTASYSWRRRRQQLALLARESE
ncbi:MAG: PEP-CTERM sorting domain-containing protein [Planctomycetia bacterium]|nr:PEP-CTERM sorting domain-containing protein [Planctomycetia bacterium]